MTLGSVRGSRSLDSTSNFRREGREANGNVRRWAWKVVPVDIALREFEHLPRRCREGERLVALLGIGALVDVTRPHENFHGARGNKDVLIELE